MIFNNQPSKNRISVDCRVCQLCCFPHRRDGAFAPLGGRIGPETIIWNHTADSGSGRGGALFTFFAGMAESEREYVREKSLEGQASAGERGRRGGRPKVFDDDMIAYA